MFHNYMEKKLNKSLLTEKSVKLKETYSYTLSDITSSLKKHILYLSAGPTLETILV